MKALIIGDVHGRNLWKKFGDINILLQANDGNEDLGIFTPDFDKYIFLGDYTDSFDKTGEQIRDNLVDIINFKKKYPRHVTLLLGNHDIQYMLAPPHMSNSDYFCSGYKPELHYDLYEIFNKNYDLFRAAYQYEKYLFTHAGIHKGWYVKFIKEFKQRHTDVNTDVYNISYLIDIAFVDRLKCLFDVDRYRGGTEDVGGIFWCDKHLSGDKPLDGYHQIVGHTPVKSIQKFTINSTTSITFCDTQNSEKIHIDDYYLKLNI